PSLLSHLTAAPTTELHTLSLHDALPIWRRSAKRQRRQHRRRRQRRLSTTRLAEGHQHPIGQSGRHRGTVCSRCRRERRLERVARSEEHTSELQSLTNIVCRLLLENKKSR